MKTCRSETRALLTLLAMVALPGTSIVAQAPSPRNALAAVPRDALIRLRTTDGRTIEGRLFAVDDSAVLVRRDATESFPFTRVQTVWLRSASSAKRGAVTGALVGAAGTAAFFALVFQAFCEVNCGGAALEGATVGGFLGLAGGAVAGGFIGSFLTHWREYWSDARGQRFTLDPSRIQVVAIHQPRWRLEPAIGLGLPLDGSRTSHVPVSGTLTVLRELRPGRAVGFEAGYMDIGGRPESDPLFNNESNDVRSTTFSILGRRSLTGSANSRAYWLFGAGVGSHQVSSTRATPAPSGYRETWPLFTIGGGAAWARVDVRASALIPVRLPSGGAVMGLLSVGPRF